MQREHPARGAATSKQCNRSSTSSSGSDVHAATSLSRTGEARQQRRQGQVPSSQSALWSRKTWLHLTRSDGTTGIARDKLSRNVLCEESLLAHNGCHCGCDQLSLVQYLPLQCGHPALNRRQFEPRVRADHLFMPSYQGQVQS